MAWVNDNVDAYRLGKDEFEAWLMKKFPGNRKADFNVRVRNIAPMIIDHVANEDL